MAGEQGTEVVGEETKRGTICQYRQGDRGSFKTVLVKLVLFKTKKFWSKII